MKSRPATKDEQEWMRVVEGIGCIVCLEFLDIYTPCAVHHCDGKTKPAAHLKTIGLCGFHHQYKDNEKPPRWISRHGDGKRVFEAEYGTEESLIEKVRARLL